MSFDQLAAEVLRLSPRQRATLAESLWQSLADPNELPLSMSDEDALALATERDAELESGKVAPLTHDELMRRLRK
jgi:putative addiction module component (TIGR02574 family)